MPQTCAWRVPLSEVKSANQINIDLDLNINLLNGIMAMKSWNYFNLNYIQKLSSSHNAIINIMEGPPINFAIYKYIFSTKIKRLKNSKKNEKRDLEKEVEKEENE